jgi:hypothetical protein
MIPEATRQGMLQIVWLEKGIYSVVYSKQKGLEKALSLYTIIVGFLVFSI